MQKGVFSLWTGTKDFKLTRGLALLFSAAVAYGSAAFPVTEIVTDIRGLEIADRLGWASTSYSTALEKFCPKGAEHVWMLGKIRAQQIQSRPFMHVDLDFLMHSPLPARITKAPVVVQSKDHPKSYHDPYVSSIAAHCGIPSHVAPYNTGIVGWNDMAFCQDYCNEAMRLAEHASKKFKHGGCVSIVVEQQLLAHMAREREVKVETAIPMPCQTFKDDFKDVQFTHLWSSSKEDPAWIAKVAHKFQQDFPAEYQKFARGWPKLEAIANARGYQYKAPRATDGPIIVPA